MSLPLFNDNIGNIPIKNKYPTYCPVCSQIYKEECIEHLTPKVDHTLLTIQCSKTIKGCYHRYDWSYDDELGYMNERIFLVANELKFGIYKVINEFNKNNKYYYYSCGDLSDGIETSQSFYDGLYKLFVLSDLDKIKKLLMLC